FKGALTEEELQICHHPWGNCAELVPWELLLSQGHILPNYWYKKDGSEGPMPHVSAGSGLVEPQGHRNNSPMVIDVIADESDRERIADFVHKKIDKGSDF